jgi:hypothetical protein
MGFHMNRRAPARGRVLAAHNNYNHRSPLVAAALPPALLERVHADAVKRGVSLSHVLRECLLARYPEPEATEEERAVA